MKNNQVTDKRLEEMLQFLAYEGAHYNRDAIAVIRELQERRKDSAIEINDDMALAFCRAISDDPVGADEVEDIKTGLRAAFANVTAPPVPVVPDEWQQWIADVAEYLEGGLEADGELEAEGSIEAKKLLSRRAAMLQGGKS
ncbi:hypothetical protein E1B77_20710 [Salmonella enterica subsp. enterica]|nr:hypothetical protein [Salmonella enterica subsp. enterica]